MNFYKRFVADIQVKTGHLTPAEFGVYDRLLDHYYATEALLPSLERCCGIARAMTKADREATARVLAEFFVLEEGGGYSQRRADEIIAEAQPKIEAARANGKHGGRPKRTHKKPSGFLNGTETRTETVDSQKASQNQTISPSTKERRAPARVARPDDVAEQVWDDWLELRRKKGAAVTKTVLAEARRESVKAAMSLDRFLTVWCLRGSQGLQADWLRPDERAGGETAFQRNARERVSEMSGGLVSAPPPGGKPSQLLEVLHESPFAIGR